MAPGLSWIGKPAGFLKVIALVFNGLALGFLTHGIGFLKFAEYRMFFIVAGGYIIILTFRLVGFVFGNFDASPGQDAVADVAGAIILIILSTMMISRIDGIGVEMHGDKNLIILSSVLSLLAGLLLGVDAIFVLKAENPNFVEEGEREGSDGPTPPPKATPKAKKEKKKKTSKDVQNITSSTTSVTVAAAGSKSKTKKSKKSASENEKKSKKGKKKSKTQDSSSIESSPDYAPRLTYSDEELSPKKNKKKSSKSKVTSAGNIEGPSTVSEKSRRSAPDKVPSRLQERDKSSTKTPVKGSKPTSSRARGIPLQPPTPDEEFGDEDSD